jgi:drug/metabolite transporter (DMT)-like permease
MAPWYSQALLALVFIGLQRFFYKVAAERDCNTALTSMIFVGTVAAVSWLLFLCGVDKGMPSVAMVWWGLVNGLAFLGSAVLTMEALRHVPAAIGYSLTRLSTVLAAGFSILYFHDRLHPRQMLGIALALSVVLLCARGRTAPLQRPGARYRWGVGLATLAMLSGTVASISSKFAALQADKWGFMAISYSFSTCAAVAMRHKDWRRLPAAPWGATLAIGLTMAALNLVGFYLLLLALETGPLSVIAPLTGLHFIIAIILAGVVYRERPDVRSVVGIVMAVAAVLLMKV